MTVVTHILTVTSLPEINATVFINKRDTGKKTPCEFELPEGIYTIEVKDTTGKYLFSEWWLDYYFYSKDPEVKIHLTKDTLLEARFTTAITKAVTDWLTPLIAVMVALMMIVMIIEVVKTGGI